MKNENKYIKWYSSRQEKSDKKYIEKHGREKFLKEASKHFSQFKLIAYSIPFMTLTVALFGWFLYSKDMIGLGIFFFCVAGLMLLFIIPYLLVLPYHKKRSKEAKEELSRSQGDVSLDNNK